MLFLCTLLDLIRPSRYGLRTLISMFTKLKPVGVGPYYSNTFRRYPIAWDDEAAVKKGERVDLEVVFEPPTVIALFFNMIFPGHP